jgi:hypothetical protein
MSGLRLIWVTPCLNPHPENRRVRHPGENEEERITQRR